MTDRQRNLIDSLKNYVSEVEACNIAKSDLKKLKEIEKPIQPNAPIKKEPTIKAKALIPLKKDKFIKSVLLCIAEFALLIFLIICIANGSNKELGFLGTVLIMLGTPASIALMIFVGLKIKKIDGISPYIRAKKENEQKIRYNQKHAKEIKEALEAENVRYNKALAEYKEKEKEYNIVAEKYEQEVEKPMDELKTKIEQSEKQVNDFCEVFRLGLGRYSEDAIGYEDGLKYSVEESDLKALCEYYIDNIETYNIDSIDDLIYEIYQAIQYGCEDEALSEIIFRIKMCHAEAIEMRKMLERLEEADKERKQKIERNKQAAQERYRKYEGKHEAEKEAKEAKKEAEKLKEKQYRADLRCKKCVHYKTCAQRGKLECGHFSNGIHF